MTVWERGDGVVGERQITDSDFDIGWQVNDALLKPNIWKTVYNKGVTWTPMNISKEFAFKNDVHADLHAFVKRLNRLQTKFTFLWAGSAEVLW